MAARVTRDQRDGDVFEGGAFRLRNNGQHADLSALAVGEVHRLKAGVAVSSDDDVLAVLHHDVAGDRLVLVVAVRQHRVGKHAHLRAVLVVADANVEVGQDLDLVARDAPQVTR
ncbi:hypothetical protein D9M69_640390 [compost metagenome]